MAFSGEKHKGFQSVREGWISYRDRVLSKLDLTQEEKLNFERVFYAGAVAGSQAAVARGEPTVGTEVMLHALEHFGQIEAADW